MSFGHVCWSTLIYCALVVGCADDEVCDEALDLTVLLQTRADVSAFGLKSDVQLSNRQIMENNGDVEYFSHFSIGHQTVSGILDTGSFELVVFSAGCDTCGQAAKYNANLSSTHTSGTLMTVQSYGSGDTYSTEASDIVQIGELGQINQTFWEVIDAKMPILHSAKFQSIIGLGPPETPSSDAWEEVKGTLDEVNSYFAEGVTPPENVTQAAKDIIESAVEISKSPTLLDTLKIRTFSVCLGAEPGTDGYIIWKDNLALEKPHLFTKVPILGKHTWSVSLGKVRMAHSGSLSHTSLACEDSSCSALIDTGTSVLAMPAPVINQIEELVSGLDVSCDDLSGLPDLVFEIGGELFSLPPDAYIAEVEGDVPEYLASFMRLRSLKTNNQQQSLCKVVIMESYMSSDRGVLWVLGMPFFRKYYTLFDIGDANNSRSLYFAEAGPDCNPSGGASFARKRSFHRRVDAAKMHGPPVLRKASKNITL